MTVTLLPGVTCHPGRKVDAGASTLRLMEGYPLLTLKVIGRAEDAWKLASPE